MSGKEIACFSGAVQYSSRAWCPGYNYTSLSPSFVSNVQVTWRTREVELSYTNTTLNQRTPMVTSLMSPRLSSSLSIVSSNSSLSTSDPKLDEKNDDDCGCDDGSSTDYDEEDGDDESKPQITRSMEEQRNNTILVKSLALLFGYLLYLFGCTKCMYALQRT